MNGCLCLGSVVLKPFLMILRLVALNVPLLCGKTRCMYAMLVDFFVT